MSEFDPSTVWAPTQLRGPEQAWLDQQYRHAEREARESPAPSRTLRNRMLKATDKWTLEVTWIVTGLTNATVEHPPPSRPNHGAKRKTGPSDPTGATFHSVYDTLERETEAFAHLTGPCFYDGQRDPVTGRTHECPDDPAVELAEMAGVPADASQVVDMLIGTPFSSQRAFGDAVAFAGQWHGTVARECYEAWERAFRDGREPSELETWTMATERLARRVSGLSGRLSVWSGRSERQCAGGCGGGAPPVGEGATCGRCRTARWREQTA